MVYVLIAVGGGLGSAARYGLSRVAISLWGDAVPFGTLLVNVLGSFLLGVIVEFFVDRGLFGIDSRLPLGTGLMGGFTTYSSFSVETMHMLQRGAFVRAGAYFAGTSVLCLLAAMAGLAVGRAMRQ